MQAALPPFDHHALDHLDLWITQTDAIRAEGPVAWTPANGGHWIVVGYPEVKAAALDWRTFSSFHDVTGRCPEARGIGIPPLAFPLILSESDPPLRPSGGSWSSRTSEQTPSNGGNRSCGGTSRPSWPR